MKKTAYLTGSIALAAASDNLRLERIELDDDVMLAPGLRIKFKPKQYPKDVVFVVTTVTLVLRDGSYELTGTASDAA